MIYSTVVLSCRLWTKKKGETISFCLFIWECYVIISWYYTNITTTTTTNIIYRRHRVLPSVLVLLFLFLSVFLSTFFCYNNSQKQTLTGLIKERMLHPALFTTLIDDGDILHYWKVIWITGDPYSSSMKTMEEEIKKSSSECENIHYLSMRD